MPPESFSTDKPLVIFYEANDFRFYGAGRVLLWLMTRLKQIRPLFVAPGGGELTRRVRAAGVETVVLPPAAPWLRLARRRGRMIKLARRALWPLLLRDANMLAQLARARGALGIHANSTRAAIYAGLAARRAGIPMWWHVRRERHPGLSERLAYYLSDRVLCVSAAAARSLAFPNKIRVIPDGVPLERMNLDADGSAFRAALGWPQDAAVVTAAASLAPNKRHDLFIHMAHRLASRFPRARFLICGDLPAGAPPNYKQALESMAGPLLATGRLAMPGFIENMAQVYAATDVLVFPSDVEGFGLVVVEAMMMGVPVVRTNTAGAEETVENGRTGFVVPVGDLDALTGRVAHLLANEALRQKMGRAAQEMARRHFTARQMAHEVETLMLERMSSSALAASSRNIEKEQAGGG
ncbi:MAG: glycosyltransferase family 4 protein [Chloroflexi bacterium]|nr:glycosyltransferase family 4 protein [Chloroflexota bacterium]